MAGRQRNFIARTYKSGPRKVESLRFRRKDCPGDFIQAGVVTVSMRTKLLGMRRRKYSQFSSFAQSIFADSPAL